VLGRTASPEARLDASPDRDAAMPPPRSPESKSQASAHPRQFAFCSLRLTRRIKSSNR
jgi:hypothetical protein